MNRICFLNRGYAFKGLLAVQNIKAVGPVVSEKKIFYFFSHSKSMETINPRGVAKFDPRGMIGTIYVEDH